jgi:hypothetical protein
LLLLGVPTGLHASVVQEESEIEIKSSHFQYTQERKGLVPCGLRTKELQNVFLFILRDDSAIESDRKAFFLAYMLYHQWLFYE